MALPGVAAKELDDADPVSRPDAEPGHSAEHETAVEKTCVLPVRRRVPDFDATVAVKANAVAVSKSALQPGEPAMRGCQQQHREQQSHRCRHLEQQEQHERCGIQHATRAENDQPQPGVRFQAGEECG